MLLFTCLMHAWKQYRVSMSALCALRSQAARALQLAGLISPNYTSAAAPHVSGLPETWHWEWQWTGGDAMLVQVGGGDAHLVDSGGRIRINGGVAVRDGRLPGIVVDSG